MAAWVGLLVTALNLIPAGQLDGGHIAYALWGKRQKHIAYLSLAILVILSFKYPGWILWILLILFLLKPAHPDYTKLPIVREASQGLFIETGFINSPLDKKRRVLALLSFFVLIISFIPFPIELPEEKNEKSPPARQLERNRFYDDLRVHLKTMPKG